MYIYRQYGFLGSIKLIKNIMLTKILFKNARLVKFPFDIRNKKNIKIGKGFSTGVGCRIEAYPFDNQKIVLEIGENFKINDRVHIAAHHKITIGNNVLVASGVFITDLSHGNYSGDNQDSPESYVDKRAISAKPVQIGNNVWLGEHVIVLPGVEIGDNSIIGAGAVVTKSIPSNAIAAGNPAKVIKCYCFESNVWKLLK